MTIFALLSCMANIGPDNNKEVQNLNDLSNQGDIVSSFKIEELIEVIENNNLSTEEKKASIEQMLTSEGNIQNIIGENSITLDDVLKNLGTEIEIISMLFDKGITKYKYSKAFSEYKLSFDVIDFLTDKMTPKIMAAALKNLIKNTAIPKEEKEKAIIKILNKEKGPVMSFYYLKLNLDKTFEKALEFVGDNLEIISKMWDKKINVYNFIEVVEKHDLSYEVLNFLSSKLSAEKVLESTINIIKNQQIAEDKKRRIIKAMLEPNIDLSICNNKGGLRIALEYLENKESAIEVLKEHGIVVNNILSSKETLKYIFDNLGKEIFIEHLVELLESSNGEVDIDGIIYLLNKFDEDEKAGMLMLLTEDEEISKDKKNMLLDILLDKKLNIEICNEIGILGNTIKYLGGNIEVIKKMWNKGIIEFDFTDFYFTKYLDIEVVNFIFDNIEEDKVINCFYYLIINNKISKENKINLINSILTRNLNIDICNKRGFLSSAIKYLGSNIEVIKKMWNKGIIEFKPSDFYNAKYLDIEVVNFLFDNIEEDKVINCFDFLIKNSNIKIKEKLELIEGIFKSKVFESFITKGKIVKEQKLRLAKEYSDLYDLKILIQNNNISKEEKIDLINSILEGELNNIDIYNKEFILGEVIQYLGDNIEIIEKIWQKGITKFRLYDFKNIKYLDIKVVNFLFDKVNTNIEPILFAYLLMNKLILKEDKITLINLILKRKQIIDIYNKEFILGEVMKYSMDDIKLIEKIWNEGIIEFKPSDFYNAKYLNIELMNFIFNNIKEDKIIDCFSYLIQNEYLPTKEKLNLLKSMLERDLNIEICNEKRILNTALEHLEDNLEIIDLMRSKGIQK